MVEAWRVVEENRAAVGVVAVTQEVPMVIRVARLPVCRVVLQLRTGGWMGLHCTGRAEW